MLWAKEEIFLTLTVYNAQYFLMLNKKTRIFKDKNFMGTAIYTHVMQDIGQNKTCDTRLQFYHHSLTRVFFINSNLAMFYTTTNKQFQLKLDNIHVCNKLRVIFKKAPSFINILKSNRIIHIFTLTD